MGHAVFVLESPSIADIMHGRRELPLMLETHRLLKSECYSSHIETKNDLQVASRLFSTHNFRVLHISAHGADDGSGIQLTSGEAVVWAELLDLFPFKNSPSYMTCSLCYATKSDALQAAMAAASDPPEYVIGPASPISWASGAIVSAALTQILNADDTADIVAAVIGIYLMYGINLNLLVRNNDKSISKASGSLGLEVLADSLIKQDKSIFIELITGRGLLSKGDSVIDWDDRWNKKEAEKVSMRKALDAVRARIRTAKQASTATTPAADNAKVAK